MLSLYQGDCLNIMNNIEPHSIDCIICDLPYGTTAILWDKIIDFNELWKQYNIILKDNGSIVLFASGIFTYKLYESNPDQYKYKLIWKKNVPTGMNSAKYRPMKYYEEILIFQKSNNCTYNPQMKERVGDRKDCYKYNHYYGGNSHIPNEMNKIKKQYNPDLVQPSDILEFNVVPNRKGKLHPTEKPVELLEWLIKTYSNKDNVILDNCMGSGTTGVACINTERQFIGIEKDIKYFKIAQQRIDNLLNM